MTPDHLNILVTGGYFDNSGECFIDKLNPITQESERIVNLTPPPEYLVKGKGFTGADWHSNGDLLVCGFNSVWRFRAPNQAPIGQLHQPDFNDLHGMSVDHKSQHIYLTNTGLDSIEIFNCEGQFLGRKALGPAWLEQQRQAGMRIAREDFPQVLDVGWQPKILPMCSAENTEYYPVDDSLAFHQQITRDYCHPNYVISIGSYLLVTLLASSEIRCLNSLKTIAKLDARPHDGIWYENALWVTTIDGRIQKITLETGAVETIFYLEKFGYYGWCRGLLVTKDWIAVGITKIKSKPQYFWRDTPYSQTKTAIIWLCRKSNDIISVMDISDKCRHSKIFSILFPRGIWK